MVNWSAGVMGYPKQSAATGVTASCNAIINEVAPESFMLKMKIKRRLCGPAQKTPNTVSVQSWHIRGCDCLPRSISSRGGHIRPGFWSLARGLIIRCTLFTALADFSISLVLELFFFFLFLCQFFLTLLVSVVGCCQSMLSVVEDTLPFESR